jgi:predicted Zn-dependent peptidase
VAHCGVIINTGTRDEDFNQHGIAHFTEHMMFKGTKKRKAYHVLSRMDDVGGEIDAWTTKEETAISASFLHEFYERAIELMNDVLFHSSFPQKEMEKEKEVIIDEINSYKDSPAENIFDDFEDLIYPGHSLGRNILGTKKLLEKYTDKDIKRFITEKYNTDQMVFCSIGNIKFEKLLKEKMTKIKLLKFFWKK